MQRLQGNFPFHFSGASEKQAEYYGNNQNDCRKDKLGVKVLLYK